MTGGLFVSVHGCWLIQACLWACWSSRSVGRHLSGGSQFECVDAAAVLFAAASCSFAVF